jgi:hypothetical protein
MAEISDKTVDAMGVCLRKGEESHV